MTSPRDIPRGRRRSSGFGVGHPSRGSCSLASKIRAILVVALSLAGTPALATWAVVLADAETGEVGIGQATCVANIDLRALSAVVVTEHGVATVQAFVDQSGLARATIRNELLAGTAPAQILDVLDATDPNHETHQYCIVDAQGRAATYTGTTAQGLAFAGGQTGQVGPIAYCVAGNVLTGAPVVAAAVQAISATSGSLADRLMAAMEAARTMGGDGRCSCSPGNPTGCGSPPPSFVRTALNGYLVAARTGDTAACSQCSGGDYYLDLNVAFQGAGGTDPVLLLQPLYDDFRADMEHLPDAVESVATLDPTALLPDGSSTALLEVELLDLNGAPIGVPLSSFTVVHAPSSDGVTTIGAPLDLGGGSYEVTIAAGTVAGVDRFRVTADDGLRPVILMPEPRLPVGVPAEVSGVRWSSRVRLEWDAAAGAVSYHVYRGSLAALSCTFFGVCRDAFDSDLTDLRFTDLAQPPAGTGFFYLVTSEDSRGNESSLGTSSCGVRSNTNPCP